MRDTQIWRADSRNVARINVIRKWQFRWRSTRIVEMRRETPRCTSEERISTKLGRTMASTPITSANPYTVPCITQKIAIKNKLLITNNELVCLLLTQRSLDASRSERSPGLPHGGRAKLVGARQKGNRTEHMNSIRLAKK